MSTSQLPSWDLPFVTVLEIPSYLSSLLPLLFPMSHTFLFISFSPFGAVNPLVPS